MVVHALLYLFRTTGSTSATATFAFLSSRMNAQRLQRLYPTYHNTNAAVAVTVTGAASLSRLGPCAASSSQSTTSETHESGDDLSNNSCTASKHYDEETWAKYVSIMETVMRENRVIRKRQQIGDEQLQLVQQYLMRPSPLWDARPSPPIITSSISTSEKVLRDCDEINNDKNDHDPRYSHIRQMLHQRKSEFLLKTNMTELAFAYCGRSLNYFGDVCARSQMPAPCLIAWSKIRECGLVPPENSVNTYLYVLALTAGMSECEQNNHTSRVLTTPTVSIHQQLSETLMDVASFHGALFEPKEKSVAVRIKMLVAQGDAAAAEECLASLPSKSGDERNQRQWKRLRTYVPLVEYYCDPTTGSISSVMRLYREMRDSAGVYFDAETYARILGTVAKMAFARSESDDSTVGVLGAGPTLLEEVMNGMAEDLLELDEVSAESLLRDFQEGFSEKRHAFPLAAQRVSIDNTTALCPETGVKLRLFTLSSDQKQELHDKLMHMAVVEHEEFFQKRSKGSKNQQRDGKLALQELARFYEWLHVREGEPITAFVDGPNVAYFGSGEMKWRQVQLVVDKLEAMGENPLVIMPSKYASPTFTVRRGYSRHLQEDEVAVMNALVHTRKKVYVVPPDYFDDYYWMLGSIATQKAGSSEHALHVPPNDPSGRSPGLRPIVVTNDLMRDHRLDLLEERLFRRWTSCHMVAYSIQHQNETNYKDSEVSLIPADFFSCEIQRNIAAKFGDNTTIWHVPVAGWPEHDRLCLMIRH